MPSLSRRTTGNPSLLPTLDPVLGGALSDEGPSTETSMVACSPVMVIRTLSCEYSTNCPSETNWDKSRIPVCGPESWRDSGSSYKTHLL